jgi:hypothetical protein
VRAAELELQLHALGPALDERLSKLDEDATPRDLALLLLAIRALVAFLRDDYRDVEGLLVARMRGARQLVLDDLGIVEVHRKVKRTRWNHDELCAAIAARVSDEPAVWFDVDSGELLPFAQIAANIVQRVRETTQLSGGKLSGLRAMGIQADEYCEVDVDGYSVQLPETREAWRR